MLSGLVHVLRDSSGSTRGKLAALGLLLAAFNVGAWALAWLASTQLHDPQFVGVGLVAYGLGLRHAVDADHIAAIDNVTRKLMQEGQRPIAVGTFFSLGHSTIVVLLSAVLAAASLFMQHSLPGLRMAGQFIGTGVSAAFLFLIAGLNLVILLDIIKAFHRVTHGGTYNAEQVDAFLAQRGLMGRFFRPLFRLIRHSWMMYPVGILFGLGFDTASEVGLLALAALAARGSTPFVYVMSLPLLFTAGMSLIDTSDGVLMLGAYGWAFVRPVRKLYYNLNITLISVLLAVVIGSIEVVQIVIAELRLTGPVWNFIANTLSLSRLGFFIVAILAGSWLISTLVYRLRRYELLDDPEPRAAARE